MNAQQMAPLSGYAQEFGTKKAAVFELAGPAAYATGGQTIAAAALGWGGFDFLSDGNLLSYSGTYYLRIQPLPVDAAPTAQKSAVPTVKVLWYVLATNAEVAALVDLSTEIVRLFALGV